MNQEKNSFGNLHSSQDDVQIETVGSISAGTITSTSLSAILTVPKIARDNFSKICNMKQNKR